MYLYKGRRKKLDFQEDISLNLLPHPLPSALYGTKKKKVDFYCGRGLSTYNTYKIHIKGNTKYS